MKYVMAAINIPPKAGMAMGTMMSAPLPVDVRMGSNAITVVAEVITAGRMRLFPARTTASRIPFRSLVGFFSETLIEVSGDQDTIIRCNSE